VILASPVRIPLWDMGVGSSDETYKPRSRVAIGVAQKEPSLIKAIISLNLQPCQR
jgi:hypothetical protein